MSAPSSSQPPPNTASEPWLGLASYQEADSSRFFGREDDTAELLRLIKREVLTVVFGPSGCGKTSLLQAGLFPCLRGEHFFPVKMRLDYQSDDPHPRQQMKAVFEAALREHGIEAESSWESPVDETLWEYFRRVDFWDKWNSRITPVLVFDQFEEIFTLGAGGRPATSFLSDLADLVEDHIPANVRATLDNGTRKKLPSLHTGQAFKVVLVIREEYVARLDQVRKEMPVVMQNRFAVSGMTGSNALLAVTRPGGGIVDNHIAGEIVRFVARQKTALTADFAARPLQDMRVDPALLSVVCRELNARRLRKGEKVISSRLLAEARTNVLDDFYEQSFEGLAPVVRIFVEDHLVTESGYRGTIPAEEATGNGIARVAITLLIDRRILREENRLGIPHLELAHDLLTEVVRKSRAGRQLREQREAEDRERFGQHRKRLRIILLAVAAFMLVGISLFAYLSFRAARREATAALIARAGATITDDPEQSVVMGVHGLGAALDDSPSLIFVAANMLHEAILRSQSRREFVGHKDMITSVAYSPDATQIATASWDTTAKVWNVVSGQPVFTLQGHTKAVYSVAFGAAGKYLVTGSEDGTARLWDRAGKELRTFQHDKAVNAAVISPDGNTLATASEDGTARLWDVQSGKPLYTLAEHRGPVKSAAFNADGKLLATAGADAQIILWDARTGRKLRTLSGHGGTVNQVAFSPDGKTLASGSDDQTAKLWDLANSASAEGRSFQTFPGNSGYVRSVAFSPDGLRLAVAGESRLVEIWHLASGDAPITLRGHEDEVRSVTFSPDGAYLASGSWDKTARLWNSSEGMELLTLTGHLAQIHSVAYNPNGDQLVTASDDYTARVWDAHTGRVLASLGPNTSSVLQASFSPDGKTIATAAYDDKLKLWDAATWKMKPPFAGQKAGIRSVAFSGDGNYVATGNKDHTATVWRLTTGASFTFPGHTGEVWRVAFSPDGTRLATADDSFTAIVWDVASQQKLHTLEGHINHVKSVAFSPDGKLIATASEDHTIKLWEAASGKNLRTLVGHQSYVQDVAFNADGTQLASASVDGSTKVWDVKRGTELMSLTGHAGYVLGVAYSRDGKQLATAGADKKVQLYALDLNELLKLAHTRITRPLTHEECKHFFDNETCPPLPGR